MGISLDLAKTPQAAVVNVLLPFLPGGTLVLGILVGVPQSLGHAGGLPTLNTYERLALIIFFSYVSGFALVLLVDVLSSFVCGGIAIVFAKRLLAPSAPWNDLAWRKTARAFLPPGLAPAKENISQPTAECEIVIGAPDKPDSLKSDVQVSETEPEWRCWYGVLSAYLRTTIAGKSKLTEYFMSTLTTLGVVGLLLLSLGAIHHWLFWTGSTLMILVGSAYKLSMSMLSRLDTSEMTAELLRELNGRSAQSETVPKKPPT
jgi:hypothetical protein